MKRSNKKASENQRFYRMIWDSKPPLCEECGQHLPAYSASFISHIIPKGANTALRSHPENARIYCLAHHHQWEFGDRKSMKTYAENEEIKTRLTLQYYQSK